MDMKSGSYPNTAAWSKEITSPFPGSAFLAVRVYKCPFQSLLQSSDTYWGTQPDLEGLKLKLKLKLKLQYCGHLMGRTNSLERTLTLGKIEGRRRKG